MGPSIAYVKLSLSLARVEMIIIFHETLKNTGFKSLCGSRSIREGIYGIDYLTFGS